MARRREVVFTPDAGVDAYFTAEGTLADPSGVGSAGDAPPVVTFRCDRYPGLAVVVADRPVVRFCAGFYETSDVEVVAALARVPEVERVG